MADILPPRRLQGRLRKLTTTERAKRQAHRERTNPERETQKLLGAPDTTPRLRGRGPRLAPDWFKTAAARLGWRN